MLVCTNRFGIVVYAALAVILSGLSLVAAEPPNLIILFADDLGYGDLGCYGHPTIQTLELDRMAREGVKLTQFYVGASVCTPSRAALLTGRYPIRSGLTHVLIPSSPGGLPAEEVTLAEILKQAGYATACIGKWHLGARPEQLPLRHGFDTFLGIPYSNDMSPETQPDNPLFKNDPPTPLIRDTEVTNPDHEPDQRLLTKWYTEEAQRFMRLHAGKRPFFIYLAHTMPHVPLYASERFRGRSLRGLYGDTVEELDWSTGEILRTARDLGIAQNTLTVFLSDNGPWLGKKFDGGSSGPFYEGKVSTWEGGFRVPAIFHWPGRIPAGVTSPAFATAMDLFRTAVHLGGAEIPRDREIDGHDLTPVLVDGSRGRDPEMFYYFGDELWAARKGPWKIHTKTTRPASVEKWGNWPIEVHDPPLLFNLDSDPQERFNLAAQHPEIVAQLRGLFHTHKNSMRPGKPQR
jgi:arylsulfatase A-like enzyme